jgi:plasmid stabilization system protein ParE
VKRVARFHHLARRELIEAAEYYDRESPGLGVAFLDAVEASVSDILEHPEAGTPMHENVRRRLVQRFPYGLLYALEGDSVRVLAVAHLKRRPMYWIDRA